MTVDRCFRSRLFRHALMAWGLAWVLAGCGGGSSSGDTGSPEVGARQFSVIASRQTSTDYPLSIYTPPASAGPRDKLPVIYVLDGQSWFETFVGISETTRTPAIIVAVHTAGQRNRDFVPVNTCTGGGGGHLDYLQFLRTELLPHIESTVGGDPKRRTLFGHSHGGSFVLYALFAEDPASHSFKAYWASDTSIACMSGEVYGWSQAYAGRFDDLPVLLHLSYASNGNQPPNADFASVLSAERYRGFTFRSEGFGGTHSGIVPLAVTDAMAFTFPGSR